MTNTAQTTVNTTGAANQSGPVSVAIEDGGFLSVWYNDAMFDNNPQSIIHAQQFDSDGNKIGGEVQIGVSEVEPDGSYDMPPLTATALSDGNIVIGWQADDSANVEWNGTTAVVGSVFDTTNQTASSQFQMNTTTATNQSAPTIVGLDGGGFVSVWYDSADRADESGIVVRAQQFDNDGAKVGGEVQVGTSQVETEQEYDMPPLTATELSDGNVAIGWQADSSANVEGNGTAAVAGSVFDTTSQSASSEFQMNTSEATDQNAPVMVGLEGGGFVSVWYDESFTDNKQSVVRAQQFDNDGNKVGGEVQVGVHAVETSNFGDMPPLTAVELSDGNVAIGWQTEDFQAADGTIGSTSVAGSIFDTTSQTAGSEFQINPSKPTDESPPILVSMNNGTFVAVWYETSHDPNSGNVFAQSVSNDGTKLGGPVQIGTSRVEGSNVNDMPMLTAVLVDGHKVQISWQSDTTQNADSGAFTNAVITSTFIPTVVCFCNGTMIDTPDGRVAVVDLQVGDLLVTRDHGLQPIRWIGRRKLDPNKGLRPSHLPVRIPAGALGEGTPDADLRVSPQHRFVVRSKIVSRMYDCDEVLVPAVLLCGLDQVSFDTDVEVFTYFHILRERHEIIFANGAQAETLLLGDLALKSLTKAQLAEVRAVETDENGTPALPIARGRMAKQLIHRHAKNGKPVFSGQMRADAGVAPSAPSWTAMAETV